MNEGTTVAIIFKCHFSKINDVEIISNIITKSTGELTLKKNKLNAFETFSKFSIPKHKSKSINARIHPRIKPRVPRVKLSMILICRFNT